MAGFAGQVTMAGRCSAALTLWRRRQRNTNAANQHTATDNEEQRARMKQATSRALTHCVDQGRVPCKHTEHTAMTSPISRDTYILQHRHESRAMSGDLLPTVVAADTRDPKATHTAQHSTAEAAA